MLTMCVLLRPWPFTRINLGLSNWLDRLTFGRQPFSNYSHMTKKSKNAFHGIILRASSWGASLFARLQVREGKKDDNEGRCPPSPDEKAEPVYFSNGHVQKEQHVPLQP